MIDLHTHSLFSDGVLIPAELVQRAKAKGYEALAITDHADRSNLDWIIARIVRFCEDFKKKSDFNVFPGIELTHVLPETIFPLTQEARKLGAQVVVVHGETIVEPVPPGTNRAALEAGVDILAHPGLISKTEVLLAKGKGILLEISARRGHCLTNGHVARLAKDVGAPLILDTDAHEPEDLLDSAQALRVILGAGLVEADWENIQKNAKNFVGRILTEK
ncbi:MAG: histidinol phosphate phosphatase domain-containing protein [Thermodesulfobacteriota bacterium]|nr:MAG: histidinol phosphate phosphatase domain-containing protein [Thermodesulfobacteriota bacterium]